MCETKAVLVSISILLLVAATGFCMYQVNAKVGHYSEFKIEIPCEKENKKYCLNGGNAII